jgi:hypothetical protein
MGLDRPLGSSDPPSVHLASSMGSDCGSRPRGTISADRQRHRFLHAGREESGGDAWEPGLSTCRTPRTAESAVRGGDHHPLNPSGAGDDRAEVGGAAAPMARKEARVRKKADAASRLMSEPKDRVSVVYSSHSLLCSTLICSVWPFNLPRFTPLSHASSVFMRFRCDFGFTNRDNVCWSPPAGFGKFPRRDCWGLRGYCRDWHFS